MMCQKVFLMKSKTDRGDWALPPEQNIPPIGDKNYYWWIRANSWGKRWFKNGSHPIMCVLLEDGMTLVPVEVLEFSNEWEDKS